jgi:putative sugar O-methyltransferase
MLILDVLYKTIDLPFRLINFTVRRMNNSSLFSDNKTQSDSQAAFYENAVSKVVSKKYQLKRFRRAYNYREILEHLDYKDGKEYVAEIIALKQYTLNEINGFKLNDTFGNPRKFNYQNLGFVSPTTLRYIHVATDIHSKFEMSKIRNIVEIGSGYGGQIAILNTLDPHKKNNYFVFDLPKVQILVEKYLNKISQNKVIYLNIQNFNERDFDLVISNYAFSELPFKLQEAYLNKVLVNSKNGYLIMNTGMGNITGRSRGKMSLEYIKSKIPNVEIYNERPLTGPDNYLIIWQN